MPMAKRKAIGHSGGKSDSGKKMRKKDNKSNPGSSSSKKDRKSKGPRLPLAIRKQVDLISTKDKYGKDESEGEDEGLMMSSDSDESGRENDFYEYVAQKPQEELMKNKRFDSVEKVSLGLPEDFEDEDIPSDDELVNGVGNGKFDDSDEEEDDDEERHARMLNRVTNMPATVFKGERKNHDVVVHEVLPESEYNPTRDMLEGSGKITLEDLMGGFGKKSEYSKVRKGLKELEKKSATVLAPLPKPDKERLERKVAYEKLKKDVTKMEPVVKRNREAATLYFDSNTNVGFSTVGAYTAEFKPETDFEKKMASLVHDSMLVEAHRKDGSRLLEINKVSIEDVRERQNHLAQMRSLLFRHEMKFKHINKIKSKTYRSLNKKGKLKALGDLHMDPESAKEEAMKQEFKRAEERMTLKHKNSSKWAKRNLQRGLAIQDEGTRAAMAQQLHTHEILKRKMKSMNSDSSSDEEGDGESSDGSDEDGASEAKLLEKAKQKTQKLMEEDEELPNSGVFSLPFMARGMKKKKDAANEAARLALQDFEKSSNNDGTEGTQTTVTNGRRVFGDVKKKPQINKRDKPEVEYNSSDSEYEDEPNESADLEHQEKPKEVNINAALFEEETDNAASSVFTNFKDIVKDPVPNTAIEVSILAPKPVKKVKSVVDPKEKPIKDAKMSLKTKVDLNAKKPSKTVRFDLPEKNAEEISEESDTDSGEQMINGVLSSGTKSTYEPPSQADLIRLAFAGDDVVDEFEKEKQAVINQENPAPEEPALVPGWGDWTQTQKKRGLPPWMVKEYEDAKRKREEEIKRRKDSNIHHAIISANPDKRSEKLFTKTLPFPFTSRDAYHQSIRMPTGPDFVPASAVSEMNRGAVMKRSGVIIPPIQYEDAIPYENADDTNSQKTKGRNKSGKTFSVKPKPIGR